jgi:phasin family protein
MLPVTDQIAGAAKTMLPMTQQFNHAVQVNLEAQVSIFTAFSTKALESVQQVVDLSLHAVRASIEESATAARQVLAAKDPQELLSVTTEHAQPAVAKAITFSRQLAGIVAATPAEVVRTAEEQVAETGRKVSLLIDEVSKTLPPGSEDVVVMMKSAIDNANASYRQFSQTTKQAVESVEANLKAAIHQPPRTAGTAAATVPRGRKR